MRRIPSHLAWPEETDAERLLRRRRLLAVDHLLFAIEEHNGSLGGRTPVPAELWRWFVLLGGRAGEVETVTGAGLYQAAIDLQEPLLLSPLPGRLPRAERTRAWHRQVEELRQQPCSPGPGGSSVAS